MKQTGDQPGESHAPARGGEREGARARTRDVVIVNLPDHFDINDVFRSEEESVEAKAPEPMRQQPEAAKPPPDVLKPLPEFLKLPPEFLKPPAEPVEPPRELVTLPPEPVKPTAAIETRPASEPVARDRDRSPSLSIADLLDNRVRLEWHESVAIAQHLCSVMVRDPAANVHHSLIEPWNVEITKSGDVQVLPGGSSSDPLVKQVGRVLYALLQDSSAPAELRLVASQASFEVPVYTSVEELSAALKRFERPGDMDAIRAAFNRGLEAKFSVPSMQARPAMLPAPPAAEPSEKRAAVVLASSVSSRSRSVGVSRGLLVAAAVMMAAAVVVVLLWTRTSERTPESKPLAFTVEQPPRRVETPPATPAQRPAVAAQPVAPPVAHSPTRPLPIEAAPTAPRRAVRPAAAPPIASVTTTPPPRSPVAAQRPLVTGAGDFAEAERRAAGLFAAGRADEAALSIDAIVMRDPFYKLDPAHSSPEALAALRNSKRVFFPGLARRHYQEARAAFEAGDLSLTVSKAERALALLNDPDADAASPDLSAELSNLVARVTAVRTLEEEKIYTIADLGVTPPRPLGRQLSSASLPRASLPPTGRLEILVDRTGRVETVKLDTPMNGYHDRMIVSAVKAWHYKPALKNGKPVRFNLVMSINLPDL